MSPRLAIIAISVTCALAACKQHNQPGTAPGPEAVQASVAPERAPAPTVAHANAIEVAVGGPETQQPLPVPAGGAVAGQVVAPTGGRLVGVSVLVGNFFNSSTGALDLEACVAERCTRGSADAALSVDNSTFDVPLSEPLEIAAGDLVTYRFARPDGANDIVLWSFAAPTTTDHLQDDATRTVQAKLLLQ